MLTLKQGIKLSAIIDKLGITIPDASADQAKVGADLIMQLVSKAHLAEQELYAFVASVKGMTPQEAEDVDLIAFLRELFADAGFTGFFSSAAASGGRASQSSYLNPTIGA